jgi:signal transduction histidine kinase
MIQEQLTASTSENPDLGLRVRAQLSRLDGKLLLFQLSEDPKERDAFHQEARVLSEQMERGRPSFRTTDEVNALQRLLAGYESYLNSATPLLEKGVRGIRRDTAGELSREISALSEPLLGLSAALTEAHQSARHSALKTMQGSLAQLKWLLQFSLIFVVILLLLTVGMVYRGFVAPLRSELSQSRALIERQEKLASLGTLAAGVAHEIRNPLTAIKFRLFSLRKSLADHVADQEDLQVIGDEIHRLERIVRDFLQFARPSKPEFAKISALQLLEEVRALLAGQLEKQNIQITVEPTEPIELEADKEQLKQVLINLIQNAADSTDGEGVIRVRARQGLSKSGKIATPTVILEVSDNGKGIQHEVEARLFDPFFSTKEGGIGLGLPIAARIVEQHGGHIQYQTQKGGGTTFSVLLPRAVTHGAQDIAHRG